jgi:hypothetical protein
MRSAVLLLALCCTAAPALAQPTLSITPSTYILAASGTTTAQIDGGLPFTYYALVGSGTNRGFSYAGTPLAVGPDVRVLAMGELNALGRAVVTVNPPFPLLDRNYLQAVTSMFSNFPLLFSTSNSVVLVNVQGAGLFMPVGGAVSAAGNLVGGSPGLTVSKSGSTYTISHAGQFPIPTVVPSVTVAGGGGATVTSLLSTADQTVVTLSADAAFWFTLQPVRQ